MKNWTKTGEWRMARSEGPWYTHASGRAIVRGGWGTLGDNMRGWRKTKCYTLSIDGVDVDSGSLKRLVRVAEKRLAPKPEVTA